MTYTIEHDFKGLDKDGLATFSTRDAYDYTGSLEAMTKFHSLIGETMAENPGDWSVQTQDMSGETIYIVAKGHRIDDDFRTHEMTVTIEGY